MWRVLWLFRLPLIAVAMLFFPHVATGAFTIITHDAVSDPQLQQLIFHVTFSEPPDFLSTDESGQPRHGFQYWYDSHPGGFEFAGEDVVVIRGVEIRFNSAIPIRESINPDGEEFPNAEGWGAQRGLVDFSLAGATLTFAAGWDELGEQDVNFSYRLFAFEFGELTSDVSQMAIVSLPAGVLVGVIGMPLVYVAWRKSTSTGTRTSLPLSA